MTASSRGFPVASQARLFHAATELNAHESHDEEELLPLLHLSARIVMNIGFFKLS